MLRDATCAGAHRVDDPPVLADAGIEFVDGAPRLRLKK
jgi:hypothetical protein